MILVGIKGIFIMIVFFVVGIVVFVWFVIMSVVYVCCIVILLLIGNVLEWYDFFVYGFFVFIIGKLFFLVDDEWVLLLFVVGSFGVLFIMWLVGVIVLGMYVDRKGCKVVLMLLILLMIVGILVIVVMLSY